MHRQREQQRQERSQICRDLLPIKQAIAVRVEELEAQRQLVTLRARAQNAEAARKLRQVDLALPCAVKREEDVRQRKRQELLVLVAQALARNQLPNSEVEAALRQLLPVVRDIVEQLVKRLHLRRVKLSPAQNHLQVVNVLLLNAKCVVAVRRQRELKHRARALRNCGLRNRRTRERPLLQIEQLDPRNQLVAATIVPSTELLERSRAIRIGAARDHVCGNLQRAPVDQRVHVLGRHLRRVHRQREQ